ncbi:hypothetical protein V1520DRAFT_301017 [Lipomyces starkeyi]|uniref:Ribosomal lysine N-methyltransferase 5 n=1 Tax=Lipomyces starkeyi NRRL Y-11557 TaxID=675824 RepID=A0A1E3Q9T2_LIPST|nr:hypothetical protein LIPSTDRAFT_51467 [Lipomyces starkeyi NRRL Y-11557]
MTITFDALLDDRLEQLTLDDTSEHIFTLFSQHKPPDNQNLGYISRTAHTLPILIRLHASLIRVSVEFEIHQSLELLNSQQENNTTGAVLWQITPLFAEWLLTPGTVFHNLLFGERESGSLDVIEIGAGTSGILACALSLPLFAHYENDSKTGSYIATDQSHILRMLKKTWEVISQLSSIWRRFCCIEPKQPRITHERSGPRIEVLELDWEHAKQDIKDIHDFLWTSQDEAIIAKKEFDIVVACDTVYNDFLIAPFVNALKILAGENTHILLGMQLRSHDVQEAFLREAQSNSLDVWHVLPEHLSERMQSGFAVYYLRRS